MKRIVLLVSLVAALSLCVTAQTLINFNGMPKANIPNLMPFYAGMSWENFYYVTPGLWNGEGPGFVVGPNVNDVVFTGGPMCHATAACGAKFTMSPIMSIMRVPTFTPVSILLSAGWHDNYVTVRGYNNGKFVGELRLKATTTPKVFPFPSTWRVTELVFTPQFFGNAAAIPWGSAVIYSVAVFDN